jgi:hypothetical protein
VPINSNVKTSNPGEGKWPQGKKRSPIPDSDGEGNESIAEVDKQMNFFSPEKKAPSKKKSKKRGKSGKKKRKKKLEVNESFGFDDEKSSDFGALPPLKVNKRMNIKKRS